MVVDKARELAVDTLRGVATLLLVLHHSCNEHTPEVVNQASATLDVVRMPLFTVISGYVYAMRPISGELLPFLAKKARRLIPPTIIATSLTLALKGAAQFEGAWWKAYFFAYEHFWFIQAVLLVIVIVALLEKAQSLKTIRGCLITLGISVALGTILPTTSFFSIQGAYYLAPFFILGIALKRFPETFDTRHAIGAALVITLMGLALNGYNYFDQYEFPLGRRTPLGYLVGVAACVLFFRFRFSNRLLAKIGTFSLCIYLYHLIGVSVAERVALRLALPAFAVLLLKWTMAVSLPILGELVTLRIPVLKPWVLGVPIRRPHVA